MGGRAAWLTVTVWPATTTVAVRPPAALLVTATVAVPGPEPLPLTDAHDEPDDEVHVHPAAVVTDTVAVPEPDWKVTDVGDTVKLQGGVDPAVALNAATIAALLFRARALSCDAVPVTRPP